ERDYHFLKRERLTVWDDQHPAPKAADPEFERKLLRWFHDDASKQIAEASASPEHFRELCGGAAEVLFGHTLADVGEVKWEMVHKNDRGTWLQMDGLLQSSSNE